MKRLEDYDQESLITALEAVWGEKMTKQQAIAAFAVKKELDRRGIKIKLKRLGTL